MSRSPPAGIRFRHPYRDAVAAGPTCPLDAHPLEPADHPSGQRFLACPACFGAWLDFDVFKAVLAWTASHPDAADDAEEAPLARVFEMGRQKHRNGLRCPECGEEMIAEEHRRDSYVLVDICPAGCGKWLDEHDLRRLVAYVRARGV